MWTDEPDWKVSNSLDWVLLWKSVDEQGPDPMLGMMDYLREQQEENRAQSPVEIWCREFAGQFNKWVSASDLHLAYRQWEQDAFPRHGTSLTTFGRQLTQLANTPDFPIQRQRQRGVTKYRAADKETSK